MATGYEVKMYNDIGRIAGALETLAKRFAPTPPDLTEFDAAVKEAREAAEGDSNDTEIEALQGAIDLAEGLIIDAGWRPR